MTKFEYHISAVDRLIFLLMLVDWGQLKTDFFVVFWRVGRPRIKFWRFSGGRGRLYTLTASDSELNLVYHGEDLVYRLLFADQGNFQNTGWLNLLGFRDLRLDLSGYFFHHQYNLVLKGVLHF